jgi:hypothetical protein
MKENNQFFSKHKLGSIRLFYTIAEPTSLHGSSHYLRHNGNAPTRQSTYTSVRFNCVTSTLFCFPCLTACSNALPITLWIYTDLNCSIAHWYTLQNIAMTGTNQDFNDPELGPIINNSPEKVVTANSKEIDYNMYHPLKPGVSLS